MPTISLSPVNLHGFSWFEQINDPNSGTSFRVITAVRAIRATHINKDLPLNIGCVNFEILSAHVTDQTPSDYSPIYTNVLKNISLMNVSGRTIFPYKVHSDLIAVRATPKLGDLCHNVKIDNIIIEVDFY